MEVGKGKIVRMIKKGRWSVKREMSHLVLSDSDRPSCNESRGDWRVEESEVSNNCLQTIHSRSDSEGQCQLWSIAFPAPLAEIQNGLCRV